MIMKQTPYLPKLPPKPRMAQGRDTSPTKTGRQKTLYLLNPPKPWMAQIRDTSEERYNLSSGFDPTRLLLLNPPTTIFKYRITILNRNT